MDLGDDLNPCGSNKPRKLIKVKQSPLEIAEAMHVNKKYWNDVFEKMDTYTDDTLDESKKFSEVLPSDLYRKVCEALNIPMLKDAANPTKKMSYSQPRRSLKEPMLSFRTSLYIERELETDTEVEVCSSDDDERFNIHKEFLSKPVREQVTWATHYLKPEREDEKSLVKKADDLTDRISREFCEYMKELGGDQQSQLFTPDAIKELFQIEFDTHVARSLRVVMKELPCIDENVARVTGNIEKSRYSALDREISKDIAAESRSDLTQAFGRSLPLREQRRVPRNSTKKLWRSSRHVPRDLVTLKTVWEGITNLRSVKEYCRWMIDHPEHRKPPYLASLGMFDVAVLNCKSSFETGLQQQSISLPEDLSPIDHIRRRLSKLTEST